MYSETVLNWNVHSAKCFLRFLNLMSFKVIFYSDKGPLLKERICSGVLLKDIISSPNHRGAKVHFTGASDSVS